MTTSITTKKARIKFAAAHAGIGQVSAITHVGWGDGGHNVSTGIPLDLTGNETIVSGEFIKKGVDTINVDETTCIISVSLTTLEGNGKSVSSCGLYDADGDLIALKNFSAKGKDAETIIEIDWNEIF